jgi:hypothetical protein
VKLLIVLVVLLGLLAAGDRLAAGFAEHRVGEQIAQRGGLAGTPDVDIRGFPLVTQAIAGTYKEVRISLTAQELRQPAGTDAQIVLRGVHVPLSRLISGSVSELPVDRIDGSATLSYALLAAQLGGDTKLKREGDGLRITRTVQLFGQTLPLTAAGTVTLKGNRLLVDVQKAEGAGVEIPPALVGQVSDLLDLSYEIPPLPFGLRLTKVRPGAEGVEVAVEATDTVLRG